MAIARSTSKHQLGVYVFGQDALAASQSDVQLPVVMGEGTQAVSGYTALFDGQVVAMGADLSAAASVGSLTIGATVNGNEKTDAQLAIADETSIRRAVGRGRARFRAGDVLGAEITTSADWNGTTADLAVQLAVLYELRARAEVSERRQLRRAEVLGAVWQGEIEVERKRERQRRWP